MNQKTKYVHDAVICGKAYSNIDMDNPIIATPLKMIKVVTRFKLFFLELTFIFFQRFSG